MKLHTVFGLAATASLSSIAAAQAVPPEKAFGARESVVSASLSPDGKTMAFLAPTAGKGNALFTVPVDGSAAPKRSMVASGDPELISSCGWVANDRLLCTIVAPRESSGFLLNASRLVAIDAGGTNFKMLSERNTDNALYFNRYGGGIVDWLPGQDGAFLMSKWIVPEVTTGTNIKKRGEGFAVERIDTRSGQGRSVVRPILNASEFISDGSGEVRIAGISQYTGDFSATGVVRYMYRPKGSTDWKDLSSYNNLTYTGFNPYAVDPSEDVVYGLEKQNGRFTLVKRKLDGSDVATTVFTHPEVDVDGPLRLGRKQRIIGVSYATDRRHAEYFDPTLEKLATSLAKALPGSPIISFEGASDDEQRLLIWAGSDNDPGRYYLLDRATKQMRPLLLSRPELDGYKLATVKSIEVKAADGTLVPAYLTLPPGSSGKGLPAIVMPHGGPQSRDEWGFDWLAQYYAHKGFAVLQPNFRGSAGYGDSWFKENGFKSWKIAIGDVVDSGRWLVSQGIADPSKLAILGWSYGGYAALQSGVVAPDLYKAIVAIAPVTDLDEFRKQFIDTTSQKVMRDWVGTGPHLKEGSPAQNVAAIKAPVMLFHGEVDFNVKALESQIMADRLKSAGKPVTLITYPGLTHSLNTSEARADMLGKSDAFLRASMGLK
ncbi:S9 family peptidase [Sphingomonas sp. ID1715]|uniref:alpha/beta hydrolase family protein n=1 Tax=Sphingomonas sp. ID1715 TaxID=1656898 RepID=UPI00148805E4|nr:alpha/beta fold hydrolase [Sphingomonas sp. ID1715]NNM77596.1 S9 family peptidase [Sphingomonas sp. ID1715]